VFRLKTGLSSPKAILSLDLTSYCKIYPYSQSSF